MCVHFKQVILSIAKYALLDGDSNFHESLMSHFLSRHVVNIYAEAFELTADFLVISQCLFF